MARMSRLVGLVLVAVFAFCAQRNTQRPVETAASIVQYSFPRELGIDDREDGHAANGYSASCSS